MVKTTLYLPDEVKRKLEQLAAETGRSEADLIREGISLVLRRREPPVPRSGVFASDMGDLSERVDEMLEGFGQQ